MTQCERIMEYMRSTGGITSMEAYDYLKITQLAARIKDLEDKGVEINHFMVYDKNSKYMIYSLKEERNG